ncbi:hypothetical protein WN943_016050 [Citrus x changshan-huyou]
MSYGWNCYRCNHGHSHGCLARKKSQQLTDDPAVSFEITYHGEHTCQLSLETPSVPSSLPELEIAQGDWQPKIRKSALGILST